MATRAYQAVASAPPVPLDLLLASLPSLPRPILSRLTARMIEHMDEMDGEADREEDDWPGGNVEDEGEKDPADADGLSHSTDQRLVLCERGVVRWDDRRD